ncbi:unnamed protein product [Arctogadus glacialis]
MASMGLQLVGVGLAVLGWLGTVTICLLPMWKVSAFVGNNIITAQTIWEGLWMSCAVQSTGQMQCKVYDSLLALPADLQAARAMVVIAILLSLLAVLLSVVGGECTTCVGDPAAKARDFYDPMVPDAQRRELGACLYVGWGASGLLLVGGVLLCCRCPCGGDPYHGGRYAPPRSTVPGKEFV